MQVIHPYWYQKLETAVLKWLYELFAPVFADLGYTFEDKIHQYFHSGYEWHLDSEDNPTSLEFYCDGAMYNDFYGGNTYQMYISDKVEDPSKNYEYGRYINYSGESECVICGELNDFNSEGDLCCCNCEESYYCAKCGERINPDFAYEVNGQFYCYDCYDNMPTCEMCEELFDPDEGGAKIAICSNEEFDRLKQAERDYNKACEQAWAEGRSSWNIIRPNFENEVINYKETYSIHNPWSIRERRLSSIHLCNDCLKKYLSKPLFQNPDNYLYLTRYDYVYLIPVGMLDEIALEDEIFPEEEILRLQHK